MATANETSPAKTPEDHDLRTEFMAMTLLGLYRQWVADGRPMREPRQSTKGA